MGTTIDKLTALEVQKLAKGTERAYHGDGGGLWLQVSPGGASWVFRYRSRNERDDKGRARLKEMGLGPLHTVGLAKARERAREARELLLEGKDPLAERKAARQAAVLEAAKAMTFKQCAEAYIASQEAGWRNAKHRAQWSATLETYVYPVFGQLPVQSIDVGLVLKAIEPIWTAKPETASRVRGRIDSVLNWATVREYRQGENPARWRGHLKEVLLAPTRAKEAVRLKTGRDEHHAALPFAKLGNFMADLRQQDGNAARALEFAILTAARTGEVIGARWDECDLASRVWTIPAARMKARKEHRVPLSDAALAIVEKMAKTRSGDYVFPGARAGQPLSNMALLMTLRRMNRGDLTAHGFRSTFRDWAAERTAFPAEVAELALAHAVGNKVEAAYRRGDLFGKRRQLAEAWARYCAAASEDGKVVALSRNRR